MTDYRKPDAYAPPQFPAERLRQAAAQAHRFHPPESPAENLIIRLGKNLEEAADKIDVQRSQIKWQAAEIERLREALEKVLHTAPWSSDDGHIQCIKEARAALQKEKG